MGVYHEKREPCCPVPASICVHLRLNIRPEMPRPVDTTSPETPQNKFLPFGVDTRPTRRVGLRCGPLRSVRFRKMRGWGLWSPRGEAEWPIIWPQINADSRRCGRGGKPLGPQDWASRMSPYHWARPRSPRISQVVVIPGPSRVGYPYYRNSEPRIRIAALLAAIAARSPGSPPHRTGECRTPAPENRTALGWRG